MFLTNLWAFELILVDWGLFFKLPGHLIACGHIGKKSYFLIYFLSNMVGKMMVRNG